MLAGDLDGVAQRLEETARKLLAPATREARDGRLQRGMAVSTSSGPRELRPKNAYNLVRLLATATRWLREGEPMFEVAGDLRARLLAIKKGEVSLDDVLAEAEAMAPDLERARDESTMPRRPDVARADAVLRRVGEELARRWAAGDAGPLGEGRAPAPGGRVERVNPTASVREVLSDEQRRVMALVLRQEEARREHVVVYLSGAHAYGFPSPDSDLDLKAIHVVKTADLLGFEVPAPTIDRAEIIDGVEVDYTSNELAHALAGILGGNGNFIERALGRMTAQASSLLGAAVAYPAVPQPARAPALPRLRPEPAPLPREGADCEEAALRAAHDADGHPPPRDWRARARSHAVDGRLRTVRGGSARRDEARR